MGVGKKLQQLIALRNRNVNDIAQAINVSSSTLYSIIRRDNNKVDIDVLQDIANELDVTLDYFTSDNNQSTADLSPSEQSLIKKYRLLSAKEQAAVDNLINNLSQTEKTPAKIDYSRFKTAEEIMKEDHLIAKGGGKVNISKENLQKIIEKAKKDE